MANEGEEEDLSVVEQPRKVFKRCSDYIAATAEDSVLSPPPTTATGTTSNLLQTVNLLQKRGTTPVSLRQVEPDVLSFLDQYKLAAK